ncbi:hypothetical protein KC874_02240 [Candidatus Saccharibacteria bacterium]|nr:hypothetical protein [Candidatus Saccharibacteria bacterium]
MAKTASVKALKRLFAENSVACSTCGTNMGNLNEKLARRLGVARNHVPALLRDAGLIAVVDHESNTTKLVAVSTRP